MIQIDTSMVVPLLGTATYGGLLYANAHAPRSRVYVGFTALAVSFVLANLALVMAVTSTPAEEWWWERLWFTAAVAAPFLYMLVAVQAAEVQDKRWRLIPILYLGLVCAGWFGDPGFNGFITPRPFLKYGYGNLAIPVLVVSGFLVASSVMLLLKNRRRVFSGPKMGYLVAAGAVMLVGMACNQYPPLGVYYPDMIGSLGSVLLIMTAMFLEQQPNLIRLFRQLLAFSVAVVALTLLYCWFLSLGPAGPLTWEELTTIFVLAVITAIVVPVLKEGMEYLMDRALFGSTYDYRQELKNLSEVISSILDVQQVAASLLDQIIRVLRLPHACLFLAGPDGKYELVRCHGMHLAEDIQSSLGRSALTERLQYEGRIMHRKEFSRLYGLPGLGPDHVKILDVLAADTIVPIKSKTDLVGLLVLPAKQKGGSLSAEDLDLLDTVSNQVAVALENARLYREARMQAITDGLTGLYNHRHFYDLLDQEISRADRSQKGLSILMLDVDKFKEYNDRFGHVAGDEALAIMADIIRKHVRPYDIPARYGGEEFAVILPGTSSNQAWQIANRVREAFEMETSLKLRSSQGLTVSIGVANFPAQAQSAAALIRSADTALYRAKKQGRNQICMGPFETDERQQVLF